MHSKVLMMRFQRREMQIKRENQKKKTHHSRSALYSDTMLQFKRV